MEKSMISKMIALFSLNQAVFNMKNPSYSPNSLDYGSINNARKKNRRGKIVKRMRRK